MPAIVKPNATQRARLEQSRSAWQPPGTTVEIHGRSIPGGMLYVGSHVAGLWNGRPVEPALIDPKLKARQRTTYGYGYQQYSHWQLLSYHKLSPTDRAAYLDWLAAGRPANPTYEQALLFLYGIERRVLFDARYDEQSIAEIPALLDEADRVTGAYQHYTNSNLRIAASNLRVAGEARLPGFDPTAIEPPRRNGSWAVPLALELGLGVFAKEHRPLPPRWAYSWVVCTPYSQVHTVEPRCPDEFADYFAAEYHRMFGEGILLPEANHGSQPTYRPLSPSFQRPLPVGPRGLPAVGSPAYAQPALIELIRRVSSELEPFSRVAGGVGSSTPLAAYGLLPERMGTLKTNPRVIPLVTEIDRELDHRPSRLIEKSSLLSFFPETGEGAAPTQATGISRLFERIGFGIEPDPASMRTQFLRAERVGIYRIEFGAGNYYANRDLSWPLALLSVWSYVAATDGPIPEPTSTLACEVLVAQTDLQPFESNRLRAHAAWLTQHPATMNDVRRRFGLTTNPDTDAAARTVVALASIDATMTPARITALAKVYGVLGLTSEQLHADIHRVSTHYSAPAQIIDGQRITGFGIPAAPDPHEVALDSVRIAAVREATDSIATVLHDVFSDTQSIEESVSASTRSIDLDDPYLQLAHRLATQPIWSMAELSKLAASVGLMAAGAIENLNDRASALGLEPLFDCDGEVCDCYEPTLKELLAHV